MRLFNTLTFTTFLYSLILFFSKLLTPHGTHLHNARLAYEHELKPLLGRTPDGAHLLLGEARFNYVFKVSPTQEQRELGNLYLLGSTRKGKSRHMIAQALSWSGPFIANDIKGEIEDATAGYRALLGGEDNVFRFDPAGKGHRHDPLEGKSTESDLLSAATTLLYRPDEGENAIFTERAIVMLTQIFHAGRLEGERLLPFTQKIIYTGLIGAATILEIISQKHHVYPNLATRFLDVDFQRADFHSKFLQDCWSTLSTRMNRLLTKENIRCFSGSDFTAEKIMTSKRPVSVYLRWPEKDLLALAPLIHLVWDSLMNGMIHVYDSAKGKHCQRVLALLDEIFRTGMPKLPEYATTVCGRNISLVITGQSKSQLDAAFGMYRANTLRGQMDSIIMYAPAPGDNDTADYVEHALSYTSGFAHSTTEHEGGLSNSSSEQKIPLMPGHETKLIGTTQAIVLRSDVRPFLARKINPSRFPELQRRMSMKPPEVRQLPPLVEKPLQPVHQEREPLPSWHFAPDLFRQLRHPQDINGLRKRGESNE